MANITGTLAGALLGTLVGTLAAMAYPRRQEILDTVRNHKNRATRYADSLLAKGQELTDFIPKRTVYRETYWKGGLLGLFLGAGIGILTAPKSGKQLRNQVSKAYTDVSSKTHDIIHTFKNNNHNPFLHNGIKHNGIKKTKPAKRVLKARR